MNPKILMVDDKPDVLASYADILGSHGFDVHRALSREEALVALRSEGPWDVVLLDERLRGDGGPALATSLLAEIAALSPEARTIVITGFATPQLVRSAIAAGAWDYLEKDANYLHLLLPLRVRHAVDAARERRLRKIAPTDLERELRSTWAAATAPGLDAHKKGRLLEETLSLLFRAIPGLNEVTVNRRGAAEEFDVVVTNDSADRVLAKEGSFILVECKNWSSPVDPDVVTVFRTKLRDRFGRVQLGILVGVSGFTKGVDIRSARQSNDSALVLFLDATDLTAWIDSPDRIAWLRNRVQSAALRTPS
jgi:ActR/RegA family two-component response regulator